MDSKLALRQLKAMKKMVRGDDLRLAAEWGSKYNVLIATILSAQTRDEVTIPVSDVLFAKYPTMIKLSKARLGAVEKIVHRTNYHKTKAKHIIGTAKLLSGRKIPKTTEELIKLPGVGRKVANVYLAEAEGADVIGVDTHLSYMSQKLGWSINKSPYKIEKDLSNLFPQLYWNSLNPITVKFGRIFSGRKEKDLLLEKISKIK